MEDNLQTQDQVTNPVIGSGAFLGHWQGHRRLTRRVIEAFPDHELFAFSIGGMRPFSELAMEMIKMAGPGIKGVLTGKWEPFGKSSVTQEPKTKKDLLQLWDKVTEQIDELWPQIPPQRFQEVESAFGQYENIIYDTILYFIDNEIHHRGQGYVYLRALGIEPPPFWER